MLKYLIIILGAFGFLGSYGQSITWGEQVKLRGKSRMNRILAADSNGFQTVIAQYKVVGKPEAIVDFYDFPGLSSSNSFTVSGSQDDLEVMYKINDKIYAFYTRVESENKKLHAYATIVDQPDGMKWDLGTINYTRTSQRGTFDFEMSEDGKKLLVIENPPFQKYSMEEFKLSLYDSTLTKLWDKPIKLPYLDQGFKILKKKVDAHGNVYLLTAHKDLLKKEDGSRGLPIKNYTVLAYNKTQNRLKEFDIVLKNKWVNGLNISFNASGDLVIGGFYSVNKDNSISGTFFLTIDPQTLSIKNKSMNAFSQGFLDQFASGNKVDAEHKLDDFYFDHFIVGEDGSPYFTAEQYYVRTTSFYDHRTGVTNYTYYYHYNDIVVVKMDQNAQVLWTRRIPKKQVTTNDNGYYSGYAVVPYKEGLRILYNDNMKNFEPGSEGKTRPMNNPQKSMATLVTVNKEGEISRKPLFSAQEYQSILQPRIRKRLADNSLLIYTQKGKAFRFATIAFSE